MKLKLSFGQTIVKIVLLSEIKAVVSVFDNLRSTPYMVNMELTKKDTISNIYDILTSLMEKEINIVDVSAIRSLVKLYMDDDSTSLFGVLEVSGTLEEYTRYQFQREFDAHMTLVTLDLDYEEIFDIFNYEYNHFFISKEYLDCTESELDAMRTYLTKVVKRRLTKIHAENEA